jgi:hypothetical protein
LWDPGGENVPGLDRAIAQQPVDLLDGVLGEKAAGLRQRLADDRDAQRCPGHHPQRRIRQRVDPFGMSIVIKNTVEKGPDILKLQEPALRSIDHLALHSCLC